MPLNKRITTLRSKVDRDKSYPAQEGLQLVKETATAKFDESVDAVINLGIDAKKSDQLIRGALVLPNGTGKTTRVAVFAQGAAAEAAKAAGADIVGFDDLAEKIKGGMMDFDVVIATPDAMKVVGALGQVLGPRGLMPNPKVGTVTPDTAAAATGFPAGLLDSAMANNVKDSAQQIWAAGLASFAKAQGEGSKVFEALVSEGLKLQKKTQSAAEEKLSAVASKVSGMAGDVGSKAGQHWDKLETIFEQRVAKALKSLGVPSAGDVESLIKRIDALAVSAGLKKATPAKAAKKAAALSHAPSGGANIPKLQRNKNNARGGTVR